MQKEGKEKSLFSRRSILKVGVSLFAFIPAVKYLSQSPAALAYVPCEEVTCDYVGRVCANYDCWTYNTWYDIYDCYDIHDESFCYSYYVNTGERC